jgi:hypothetical protein
LNPTWTLFVKRIGVMIFSGSFLYRYKGLG